MRRISTGTALVLTILFLVSISSAQKRKPSGVDYSVVTQEMQAAYSSAQKDLLSADNLLYPRDGSGKVISANADQALVLYTRSEKTIQDFIARYTEAHNRLPVLFVSIEAVEVFNLRGRATVLMVKGKTEDSLKATDSLVTLAQTLRATIATEIRENSFPEVHEQCQQIDESLKRCVLTSLRATARYYTALGNRPLAMQALDKAITIYPDPELKLWLRDLQTKEEEGKKEEPY